MLKVLPSTPTELGFPDKFANWRTNQAETIEESLFNDKRYTVNCAGTGFGKSVAIMTEAIMAPGRSAIVTPSKGHQDQMTKDFKGMGLVDIRGKDNYVCTARAGWTCKDGHAGGCTAKGTNACPRTAAYQKALQAKVIVTSFKYWIAEHKYGTGLGPFSHVIFDEADKCPEELADSVSVSLSYNEINNILEQEFPHPNVPGTEWKVWAAKMGQIAKAACLRKKAQIDSSKSPKPTWVKEFHHLKNMFQKLSTVALMRPGEWVWEEFSDWGWRFDPIKFHRYTESRLMLKIPKVSLYSATVRPKSCYMMGIGDNDMLFIDHPPAYDVRRSPIYYVPSQRVDHRNPDTTILSMRAGQIADPRLARMWNGLIHVTSFEYRDKILRQGGSGIRQHHITHRDGEPVAEAVARFKAQGGVFISPSVSSGYDFPDDECRFNIMTKIPWEPRSKVIKAREELDKYYGPYNAARTLEQQSGRGHRSPEDWCQNIILDNHIEWFIHAYGFLFTKTFHARFLGDVGMPPVNQALTLGVGA